MEGLREGRKGERAEGAEAERVAAGREREVEGTGEETFPVELMLWGHFFYFFNRNGVLFEIDFFCFIILI